MSRSLMMLTVCVFAGCDEAGKPPLEYSAQAATSGTNADQSLPLRTWPAEVFLGVLKAGESKTMRVWLENHSSADVHLATYTSSCRCVSLELPPRVPATSREMLEIKFDGEDDPDFTGGLLVNLDLRDRDRHVVCRAGLLVDVVE